MPLFFSKIKKDVSKVVVYYSRDWHFKGIVLSKIAICQVHKCSCSYADLKLMKYSTVPTAFTAVVV